MKKLLITGASGFLGWSLVQLASTRWQVFGNYHVHPIALPGATLSAIDLTDATALRDWFSAVQPDAVIHAAALSAPNACQLDPDRAHRINVLASWAIAEHCAQAGIPCVFTSTELVFDGTQAPYRESDPVCPINLYGEQKVAAEQGMQQRWSQVIRCRLPLMFGAVPHASSFLQPFIDRLRSGQVLNLFVDEIRTPVSGTSAAQGILLALEQAEAVLAQGGILHLGGHERLSRYEFGQLLIEVLQLTNVRINPCRQADVPMAAPRAPDVSMDSSRAFQLGYQPAGIQASLQQLREAGLI